jgi:hypothetical protein
MAKNKINKPLAVLMVVIGVVLLGMYVVMMMSGGKPSIGMLVVGLVDLFVGIVLLGRAKSPGATG